MPYFLHHHNYSAQIIFLLNNTLQSFDPFKYLQSSYTFCLFREYLCLTLVFKNWPIAMPKKNFSAEEITKYLK